MANCIRCGRQLPPLSFKKICQWCVQHEKAQRGEDVDEYQPVIRQPWVRRRSESTISLTQVLFGANLAVFLAMALSSGSVVEFHLDPRLWGANYGPLTLSGDWWRLITYMFVHAGLMHIAFNMWCLWDLGALCESLYGRWTFLGIYLITGVGGGLARLVWDPYVPSVGASGAIFGLAGALAASFYLGEFSLPSIAVRGTFRSLAFFIGFNVLFGFGYNIFTGSSGGVDNACHIGGLVSGLVLGALIARLAPQHDAPLRRASVVGVVVLAMLGVGFGVRQWRGAPMRMARAFQETQGDPVARLRTVVKEQPNLAPARFALAQAYIAKQQFPDAEAELKKVIELQPANQDARLVLGMVYLSEKRLDDSKATFSQMLAANPNSAEAHYGLGLVLAAQQNDQGAIEEFKKASGARVSGLEYEMGNSYARLKRYDDAIAAYLKEKDKSGDDPDLEAALASAYQAKGLAQQAQEAKNREAQLRGQTTQ
ncbi:MAG TPA: rhomboid family intramembrane serine protease [Dongiaceae bacterium]|nr:rhomboid family intramembrane serine protease [Dongiaceae bacterium]